MLLMHVVLKIAAEGASPLLICWDIEWGRCAGTPEKSQTGARCDSSHDLARPTFSTLLMICKLE